MFQVVAVILFLSISHSALSDDCKHLVFNEYCLGGKISELEEQKPPSQKRVTGLKTLLAYSADEEIVVVQGFDEKIMSVSKISSPGSWLNYLNLKGRIERIHGSGHDESYFPDYADSQSSQATAISLGKGQAKHLWNKDGWKIVLLWSSDKSVTLFYIDEELEKKYRGGNPEGL